MDERSRQTISDLLDLFTAKNNTSERQGFVSLNSKTKQFYSDSFVQNLRACKIKREDFEGESSLVLVIKILWKLIPLELFIHSDPDYESLAAVSIKSEFGIKPSEKTVKDLSTIFRRLRGFKLNTFKKTSLNLDNPVHRKILSSQKHCCPICLYRFPDIQSIALYDPDLTFIEDYEPMNNEVTLSQYHRRPHLDHIIPFYLGGDGAENWQVLCHTCNVGKGDSIAWLNRKGWMPPSRISDAMELSGSLRYALLASYRQDIDYQIPSPNSLLRIFKKDISKLVYYENLEVRVA